jgi:lysyl endopeptidase
MLKIGKKMKIILTLVILTLLFCSKQLISQISSRTIMPPSYIYKSQLHSLTDDKNINEIFMTTVNKDSLLNENKKSQISSFHFAFDFKRKINIKEIGTWDTLDNDNRICRLKIICPDAYSIHLIYSNFELPDGGYLFLYNNMKNFVIGAFSKINNKKSKLFATELIPGDTCWIEYYEPKEVKGIGTIEISNVFHGFIGMFHDNIKKTQNDTKEDIILNTPPYYYECEESGYRLSILLRM